jgi:hypothetical protein
MASRIRRRIEEFGAKTVVPLSWPSVSGHPPRVVEAQMAGIAPGHDGEGQGLTPSDFLS